MSVVVKKRNAALLWIAVAAVALCAAVLSLLSVASASANITKADDLFVNAQGMSVQADGSAPESFATYNGGTVARDFDTGKSGVLLSAAKQGASVDLAPTFSGDFELTFRAYSSVSYNADTGANDYNRYDIDITQYADLREVTFDFTAADGKAFSVVIRAGEKWNVITPAAHVEISGVAVGYHYLNDATAQNETSTRNANGYYTRIGGTTFCNVTRHGGANTSKDSKPVTFGFDRSNMQIYVRHYGIANKIEQHRVVLDFDDENTGLFALDSFDDYKVSVRFSEIASGKQGNIVVYDINGQSLAGETFDDTAGAQAVVHATTHAVVGQQYVLPEPQAFAVLQGKMPFAGSVRVSNGTKNYKVYSASGQEVSAYSQGCYFVPDAAGTYDITYTATDGLGHAGAAKTVAVRAFADPQVNFLFEGNYRGLSEEGTLGKGSVLDVYPASAVSEVFLRGRADYACVTLYRNNAVYGNLPASPLKEKTSVTLSDEGDYRLVYSVEGLESLGEEIAFTVSAQEPVYTLSETPTVVPAFGTFTVPTLTAQLGGASKRGTATLYAPDGTQVAVSGGKAELTEVGEYKLTYFTRFESTYTHNVYFNSMSSNENVFTGNVLSTSAESGDSGSLYPSKADGIKLTFTAPDVWMEYSRTIDLSKNTPSDPLIKVMVLPSQHGQLDFWQYTVRLTDVNDERNYVDITVFKGSWGNQFSYVRAASADQPLSGWEMDKVLSAYNTGCPINYSFTGETMLGTEACTLYYDYADKAVYVDNIKRAGYSYGNQVIDLDSTDCFSESMLFGGFTTGEVRMSISIQNLQKAEATLLITEINGVSMAKKFIEDSTPPRIGVNFGDYAENDLPLGLAGVAYPIFAADAFDGVDGRLTLSQVRVYKDYQTPAQTEVACADGKFVPSDAGSYTIVYSASDKSGNSAMRTVTVTVAGSLREFGYTFAEEFTDDYFVGEKFRLPSGEADGGSGRLEITTGLYTSGGVKLDTDNLYFTEAGNYSYKINFTDFLGRKGEVVYPVSVTVSDSPVLYDAVVPSVMLSGYTYTLEACTAVDYSTGSLTQPSTRIEVVCGGQKTVLSSLSYMPQISGARDEITINYIAENAAGKKTVHPYPVTVLNVEQNDGIDMAAYFKQTGIDTVRKAGNYVEYETSQALASLEFANPLVANNLQFELYVPAAKNNFDAFKVTYTDIMNSDIAVSIYVYKNAATSWFTLMGVRTEVYGSFFDVRSYGIAVSFNNTSCYFSDINADRLLDKAVLTDAGKPFTGFPSGKVYVTIRFENVRGASAIRVMKLGNQNFSDFDVDLVPPQVQLSGTLPSTLDIDVPVTVPAAIAADVLNPEVSATLTIRRGAETVVNAVAIDKDYVFTPTAYGEYRFIYTVKAGFRSDSYTYIVRVKDKIAPVLEILGDCPKTGKVNTAITLPGATATDNEASDVRIWIFVTQPNGYMYTLEKDTYTVTFATAGRYMITYYIEDNYGNYEYVRNYITVS